MCGMFGGGPSKPDVVPIEPIPVRKQPRLADEGVRKAQDDVNKNAKGAALRGGTLLTGAGGLGGAANSQKKTLLGG